MRKEQYDAKGVGGASSHEDADECDFSPSYRGDRHVG
jgi:hypothetical protein